MLIKGVPVEQWDEHQSSLFFWAFGQHLGIPGAQNQKGELLGHVRNIKADPNTNRHYLTNRFISYHCDLADVVGLMCLKTPKQGGISRITSSVTIYNEILRQRPDLIDRLYRHFLLDTKGDGGVFWIPVSPVRYSDSKLRTFWHQDYFESSHAYADAYPWDTQEREVLQLYETIAADPQFFLEMEFEPGDIQLISNHYVVHSRTGYEDYETLEDRRHLLRLWISTEFEQDLYPMVLKEIERFDVFSHLFVQKLKYWLS